MSTADLSVIFGYLALTLVAGIWAGLKQTGASFWVNGRSSRPMMLGFSIISTQVGAGVIIGIASATYNSGIGLTVVSIISITVGMLGIGLLAPILKQFGDKYQAVTLSEFFLVRYDRSTQIACSYVILFVYLSFLAAQFVAVAALLKIWSGIGFHYALVFACIGVVIYTAFAGLRGDILTDFIHFWVMAIVFLLVLVPILMRQVPDVLLSFPPDFWSPTHFAGWSFLLFGILLGGVLPVVSMEMWQRIYASVTPNAARKVFWCAPLIVVPFYIFSTYLGMCALATEPGLRNPDLAPFLVINNFLPQGVMGLAVAALLATLLSTANSMALVVSATLYRDILRREQDNSSVYASRAWTLAAGICGLFAALIIPNIVQLMLNAFYVLGTLFFSFIGGLFWHKSTARGATLSIALGGLTTIISLPLIPKVAFLPGLFVSLPVFVVASLLTSHSSTEKVRLCENLLGRNGIS